MSCCKNYSPINGEKNDSSILGRAIFFIIGLVVITLLIPLIWGLIVYFLFNTIRGKENNILPAVSLIWNTVLKQNKYKEDNEDESYDEDDYDLLNYEKVE